MKKQSKEKQQKDDEQEEEQEDYSRLTTRSINPSRTNKNGLPDFVQKQLLIDIENSGGIIYGEHWQLPSKTASLLNKRPDIYGTPGSQLRDKVTNKLQTWKKYLSQDDYFQLLENFGIRSTAPRPQQLLSPAPSSDKNSTFHSPQSKTKFSSKSPTPSKATPSEKRQETSKKNQTIMPESSPMDNLDRKFLKYMFACNCSFDVFITHIIMISLTLMWTILSVTEKF